MGSRINAQMTKYAQYKCLSCTSDQWETVDTVEGGGPSSLSDKFSNGTSTIDIDDKSFDDPDSMTRLKAICQSGGGVSSSLPTPSVASTLAAIVPLMVGAVGSDSSSLLPKASMKLSEDVQHQDEGKGVSIDEGEKVALKRTLEDEGGAEDSRRVKRGRMASPQETAESIPTSPSAVQDPILDSSN
ncbi:Uncharacterized protein Adt_39799 [Abeliophyllum distichum]|uniref:Uncharacterized protein n=1 Tax=Abeliophyllum distichum TaxID=126358 RepID=A0ABD1Q637_9LAMI